MNSYDTGGDQFIKEQIKHLDDLLKNSPEDPWLGLQLSQLYLADEKTAEAKSLVIKIHDQAKAKNNKEVIAACKGNLGVICIVENNFVEARKWLSSALQIYETLDQPRMLQQEQRQQQSLSHSTL